MLLLFTSMVALGTGCVQSAPPPQGPGYGTPGQPQGQPTTGQPASDPGQGLPSGFEGFYENSQWGAMLIQSTPDGRVRATYTHDQGTVEGRWVGNAIVGWWCEVPSRKAPQDAGEVELTFIEEGGNVRIDGRWRYGTTANEPNWREDWDVTRSGQQQPPAELADRFADESAFCAHPGG